ncbi:MAG: DUF5320 domain-containing protein [Paludibacter sp.]|nr:DUF5320 domain-containing protein [Paludibacter sp.]
MPKLDGTGPEREGSHTGRNLGECSNATQGDKLQRLGKGMGKKRLSGGGVGNGKRLRSNKI